MSLTWVAIVTRDFEESVPISLHSGKIRSHPGNRLLIPLKDQTSLAKLHLNFILEHRTQNICMNLYFYTPAMKIQIYNFSVTVD